MSDLDWMGDGPAVDDPMLDVAALDARVKKAAEAGDVLEIRRLLDASNSYPYSMGVRDQVVSTLMHGDFDGVLQETLEPATIEKWCLVHAHVLVEQCPELFERWARPIPRYVRCVADAHAQLDASEKLALLTAPTTPQQRFLRESLREQPQLWQELSPSWTGSRGSELRKAARALGWDEAMLPKMVLNHPHDHSGTELGALAYPRSVWALAEVLFKKPSKGLMSQGRCVQASSNDKQADVVLAQIIFEKTSRNENVLLAHNGMPDVSPELRSTLLDTVNMHVMLGSLGALLDCLVHDVLPGVDAPTHSSMSVQELGPVDFGGMV